jgi:hypothetical protein
MNQNLGNATPFKVYFPDGKKLVFDVERAQDLVGMETGGQIIQEIWPHALYFMGPRNLISFLDEPRMIGKPVTVEGLIYVSDRLLVVTEIKG